MPRAAGSGRYGEVFNEVAEEYDRHRPTYPDALIDRACEVGGLGPGATVLEIGCGTGQLTRSLLARGLRVTAIEPGGRLMARRAISSPTPGRWSSSSGALRRRRCRTRVTRPRFRDRRFTGLIRMSVGARPPTRWLIAVPSRWSPTSDWRRCVAPAISRPSVPRWRAWRRGLGPTGRPTATWTARSGASMSGAATCRTYGRGWWATSSRGGMPQTCLTTRRSPRCRRSWSTRPTRSTLCSARCRSGRGSHPAARRSVRREPGSPPRLGRPICSSTVACLVTARRVQRI